MPSLAATTSSLDPYPSTGWCALRRMARCSKLLGSKNNSGTLRAKPCNEASCQFKRVREILRHLRRRSKPATVLLESLNGGTAVVW
jgi:hypothetical protein